MKTLEVRSDFKLGSKLYPEKFLFKDAELFPSAETFFCCMNCLNINKIEIKPFKTGFPLKNLFEKNNYLELQKIIDNGLATLHPRTGELHINTLPPICQGLECEKCGQAYLLVFSWGERHNNLMECEISGIWEIFPS